ncbi:MAG: anthranilate synthase component I family protein [Bacteroidetes bacterium]|nr:anthranilate synthase component I family protein [Bacteroidota bacterium]
MRNWYSFPFASHKLLDALTATAAKYETACICGCNMGNGFSEEIIGGFGVMDEISPVENEDAFTCLEMFVDARRDWYFGHFSYDLKNQIEKGLTSEHPDGVDFPLLYFFRPQFVVRKRNADTIEIGTATADEASQFFSQLETAEVSRNALHTSPDIQARTSKQEYIQAVNQLKKHIARGDIYETNYCIEYFADAVKLDPAALHLRLCSLSEAPFAAYYKHNEKHLCCASPERFLQKIKSTLRSQPIKGTRRRGTTPEEDGQLKYELQHDAKERCENVMIVDLVRNDLSRSARRGSVHVPELFGVHTFKTVHQLISTVQAELRDDVHPVQAIKRAFPMGSMTGAPKVRAMQLCEETEHMKRGLYSGAVGYFTPDGDFDFNVVIRSIQYNAATGHLSLKTGSAITAAADAETEFVECSLKAAAMLNALGVKNSV